MRDQTPTLLIPAVALFLATSGWCGGITGVVRHRGDGQPAIRLAVRAYAGGRSIGAGAVTDNDGRFLIPNLPQGDYAVCVSGADSSRPQVASVTVHQEGSAAVSFVVGASAQVEGDSWVQAYPVFYQSFRATGLGVSSLRLKAFGPGRAVKVQLLDGNGPAGRPVGPARTTVEFGGEGEAAVYWSAGEAPTVPGKTYTFRLSAEAGKAWIPGVAGRGDVYPAGSAWFGFDRRPLTDLGFAVCEENDGLTTSDAVAAGRRAVRVRAVGQTFVARSRDILFASACLAGINARAVYVRFSIHEKSPGGRQIGPSKGTGASMDAAVAWLPGEVNVTPGRTYYLHIESFDGALFHAFEEPNAYAKGCAFNDAVVDRGRDLAGWIAGSISQADQDRLLAASGSVRPAPLVNASFEDGLKGWKLTRKLGDSVGCDNGVIPAWGRRMFGWTNRNTGEGSRTVVYQTISVKKGRRYSFSGSVYTDHAGGRSSDQKVRLVIDPAGEARFDDRSMQSSQWYATEGEWRRGSVEFVAKAGRVTVGFELEQRWSLEMCSLYADGARLEEIAPR